MKNIPIKCPCDVKSDLKRYEDKYICNEKSCIHNNESKSFLIKKKKPILISKEKTDTLFEYKEFLQNKRNIIFDSIKEKFNFSYRKTKNNCEKFINEVFKNESNPKILVIGGATKGLGTSMLWENKKFEIHSVDIVFSKNIDLICDAHYLPLKSNYYDGVWIQAVLEHVVEPIKVVREIHRVLKNKGTVYAETPFMQQVHAGSTDFTRYTVLGHRFLFKDFSAISIGGNKGPELVFVWSFKYLILSLTRSILLSKLLGKCLEFLFSPLALFTSKKSMYDASSGVFFLGRKEVVQQITHSQLKKLYKGHFDK